MLTIGILNNMPEAAIRSTERQFTDLLKEAVLDEPVEITWFSFLPRNGYASAEALWDTAHVDGLIVTGNEPRAPHFHDEPYWGAFARTVDWASSHTSSTIWSCLGAHAAVFHLDRIERRPFGSKLHGVFPVTKQREHPLLANLEPQGLPHSRWNDLPVNALRDKGYAILTRGAVVGADLFVKSCGTSLFVFLQGHPEYDERALMREYRRDILRYISSERDDYPALPANYFDIHIAQLLRAFRDRVLADRNADVAMVEFQGVIGKANLVPTWRATAVQLYRNWLALLSQQVTPVEQATL